MKNYKVGDTVFVKGTVGRTDDTRNPCYVEFGYGVEGWILRDNIIDELPTAEPVKPVLPKEVGEELDIAKNELQISFDVYIGNVIDSFSSAKASYHYYIVNTNAIIKLADAWRYGYTVENPKLYNLILGTREDSPLQAAFLKITDWDDNAHISLNAGSIPHDLTIPQYQFTQEEIDKYNEDFWIKNFDLNDYKVEVKD